MKETIVFLLSFSFHLNYSLDQILSKIFSITARHHALHQQARKTHSNIAYLADEF
jgi:hypothetical protein